MQLLIESFYKDGKKTNIIDFIPNYDILPNHQEIDAIINHLKEWKESMTNEEIEEHNKKQWEKMQKEQEERENKNKANIKIEGEIKERGFIYLLKTKNLYKIGKAKYLEERIKTYITENPFGIELIYQKEVDDYSGTETKLLEKFKDKKYRGEWFKLNKEDIKWIKQLLK